MTDTNKAGKRLLCYYGDDFTGSTDVLEALTTGGARTVLFLEPPSERQLARFPDAQCFGVAGVGRSMSPERMNRELRPLLERLKSYGTAIVHYKICSTFDSSPRAGSIGAVLELGRELYPDQKYVPIVAGAPRLRRYTVFGHHFAAGGDGKTYRLDRHPTMSRHPITPMPEADLRLHLRGQTELPVALVDLDDLADSEAAADRLRQRLTDSEAAAVLFDVLDEERLETAGRLIWEEAERAEESLFAIGSSGLSDGLAAHWAKQDLLPSADATLQAPGETDRLLVLSGSCSPVTQTQIEWALAQGYAGIQVPTLEWLEPERAEAASAEIFREALRQLEEGRSVILYSASGPDDPAIAELRARMGALGLETADSGRMIGTRLGRLARELVRAAGLRRILIAGGDTSGYVMRELGVEALSFLSAIVPGGPLCRCYAPDARTDGLELSLKGGQVGGPDYFERVRRGGGPTS
ncbi:four-carbon acid sugar kinase family protein [Cohnella cellulosilytica]|uniref:Four-carbon acid sugar kinase family protein n=1 Tax=Cohnella cellulosilytica TaxID=986710 RepID=A0ABW2FHA5_9BACL